MKGVYPVIFTESKGVILVEVPDFSILTEGKDLANAIEMARDAIGLKGISCEDNNISIPEPTKASIIDIEKGTFFHEGESYVSLVDVDFTEYRRKVDNKAVRRNVTIPNWLNQEAERAKINVSKVLQEALLAKLDIRK